MSWACTVYGRCVMYIKGGSGRKLLMGVKCGGSWALSLSRLRDGFCVWWRDLTSVDPGPPLFPLPNLPPGASTNSSTQSSLSLPLSASTLRHPRNTTRRPLSPPPTLSNSLSLSSGNYWCVRRHQLVAMPPPLPHPQFHPSPMFLYPNPQSRADIVSGIIAVYI